MLLLFPRQTKVAALKNNEEVKAYIKKRILSGQIPCKKVIKKLKNSSQLSLQKEKFDYESTDTDSSTDNESDNSNDDLSYNVVYWVCILVNEKIILFL